MTDESELLAAVRELEERCTELEERVSGLENDRDFDDIIDVCPDAEEGGCLYPGGDSTNLTLQEYLDAVERDEEDDCPHTYLGGG